MINETRQECEERQIKYLMEVHKLSYSVAKVVFDENWNRYHASAYDVDNCLDDSADYAEQIIDAYMENK